MPTTITDAGSKSLVVGGLDTPASLVPDGRRLLGAPGDGRVLMGRAVEAARLREVTQVYLVSGAFGPTLSQLGEFAAALRAFTCDLIVVDLPELSAESPERGRILDLLVRVRMAERQRYRGTLRIVSTGRRARASPTLGRPRRGFDLDSAIRLLDAGDSISATARAMSVARSTLQRRLAERGWTRGFG
jgi:hypothetical protein